MDKEFVNPNLHVALVHFPIALLVAGTLIEVFSFMWRRHGFRAAGRWMILIGTLIAIPTVTSGIYALYDVANPNHDAVQWKEILENKENKGLSNTQWEMLKDHLILQSVAVVISLLVVVTWLGSSDLWRSRLHWPLVLLLLVSVALTLMGAWHGGEAVYRYGTGVGQPRPVVAESQPPTETPSTAPESSPATTAAAAADSDHPHLPPLSDITAYAPPYQVHVILAGVATAVAMAALGLSLRRSCTVMVPPPNNVDSIAAALGEPTISPVDTLGGDPRDIIIQPPNVPASRFWLLSSLVAIVTAIAGYWILTLPDSYNTWKPFELWRDAIAPSTRRLAHAIAGVAIIAVPIIMAVLARWAPRKRVVLVLFAFLLVAAIAFQIWLGILLLYDTPAGPLTSFN